MSKLVNRVLSAVVSVSVSICDVERVSPPILLSYGLKPVFITLEDMENYLEINSSRNSSKTHKKFPRG